MDKKILLLENISDLAVENFKNAGFSVKTIPSALGEDDLIDELQDINILGIRSKTQITKKVLDNAPALEAIGAFSIGVNQIDLENASKNAVAVFNAPFANTRSVVELTIGEIILLLRRIPEKNYLAHNLSWSKDAKNCFEARGKTLGIIGYGNIGSQLSIVAESIGMKVVYFDLVEKLSLGNAVQLNSLEELLKISDIVSLHIDGAKSNTKIFGKKEFDAMKYNSIFINNSRGSVIDETALEEALSSGKLLGAAIDVYEKEPKNNNEPFETRFAKYQNIILTPHIGGSTQEAQRSIGRFTSDKLIKYALESETTLSVNFPNINLPAKLNNTRLAFYHKNIPGVLAKFTNILCSKGVNIEFQALSTLGEYGYAIADIKEMPCENILEQIKNMPEAIKLRVL